MENLGYTSITKSFLVKNINGIDINITRKPNKVETITGYKNNEVVNIPGEIIEQVKNDIASAL